MGDQDRAAARHGRCRCPGRARQRLPGDGDGGRGLRAARPLPWRRPVGDQPAATARRRLARHFAVLIPAHDEEPSIGATVDSVVAQRSAGRVSVHVVADNCTDATADDGAAATAPWSTSGRAPDEPGQGPGAGLARRPDRRRRTTGRMRSSSSTPTRSMAPDFLALMDARARRGRRGLAGVLHRARPGHVAEHRPALRGAGAAALRPPARAHRAGGLVRAVRQRHGVPGRPAARPEVQRPPRGGRRVPARPPARRRAASGSSPMPSSRPRCRTPSTPPARRTSDGSGAGSTWRGGTCPSWPGARCGAARQLAPAHVDAIADQLTPPLSVVAAGSVAAALTATGLSRRGGRARSAPGDPRLDVGGRPGVPRARGFRLARVPRAVYQAMLHAPAPRGMEGRTLAAHADRPARGRVDPDPAERGVSTRVPVAT